MDYGSLAPTIALSLMSTPASTTGFAAKAGLTLGALGVVFGDIGTSPLYALRECLNYLPGEQATGVIGALSLVFWAMTLVVVGKYLIFVMRADNRGEGGIFALLALSHTDRTKQGMGWLTITILVGAALLYGDGIITPAISVMSAVEGLNTYSPEFPRTTCRSSPPSSSPCSSPCSTRHQEDRPHLRARHGAVVPRHRRTRFLAHRRGPAGHRGAQPAGRPAAAHEPPGPRPRRSWARSCWPSPARKRSTPTWATSAANRFPRAWYFCAYPALILNYFGQGARVLAPP